MKPASTVPAVDERYSRQAGFAPIGSEGQGRLSRSRVLILGCGALGGAAADMLCRGGVGRLRLVDRDLVESSNLQRQTLFCEADVTGAVPKAVAASRRLAAVNASIALEPLVVDATAANLPALLAGCDIVIDGTDNFHIRHLLNEACCRLGIPWIYGACIGAYGLSLTIIPGKTPCLRCLQDRLPDIGDSPTCESDGIIAPAVQMVAAFQVAEVLKFLTGHVEAMRRELWAVDLWAGSLQRLAMSKARDPQCPVCGPDASYPMTTGATSGAIVLCGRNALQVRRPTAADLPALSVRLGTQLLLSNEYLVRWRDGDLTGTCFSDGRVLVQGTVDPVRAHMFCDRWLG